MSDQVGELSAQQETLSPWWRRSVFIVVAIGFAVLIYLTVKVHYDAPPIPGQVITEAGSVLFTGNDIMAGQKVFLDHGLMDNGSIWGHGGYLGPDYSASYLHSLAIDMGQQLARDRFGSDLEDLSSEARLFIESLVRADLKNNRYDAASDTLTVSAGFEYSYRQQQAVWADYFSHPAGNYGLPTEFLTEGETLQDLTAFFAWTAWAAVTPRPGEPDTYTNNWPYDPLVGNEAPGMALLWSALSLIALLGGTALVLLAFGKFDYLGWKSNQRHVKSLLVPGNPTKSQRAVIKFFVVVALLFLLQTLIGGVVAHYRAEPGDFYGMDFSGIFPSNLMRTWHLQLAIFWIATAYVAGALLLATELGGNKKNSKPFAIHLLFSGLFVVVAGTLLGTWAGTFQWMGELNFWFGQQGWEYLQLGRAWQLLLAVALVGWFLMLVRKVMPSLKRPETREMSVLFLIAAVAIPVFYLPAMFFDSGTHWSVVDTWRFWIAHLWLEGFFEFFVTVLVAIILTGLGVVSRITATRVIYLDAILYFGGGLIGTGHHWYFSGHSELNMALSAIFSAFEVIPLTLLTLDAWDFVKVTRTQKDLSGRPIAFPHKWTFYFIMAVGAWNFLGAGVFGFLINLPIVSYYEMGTMLTANHSHAALMGVFGMLAMALLVFSVRHVSTDEQWEGVQKYFKVSFWGLNIGLLMMVVFSLFPGGVMQLMDVLENGYWHARSLNYTGQSTARLIEWMRTPGDLIFIFVGVVPAVIAVTKCYFNVRKAPANQVL